MKIGVIKNEISTEKRVAITPEVVKKLKKRNFEIIIEENLAPDANFSDADFIQAGAETLKQEEILKTSDILLFVSCPSKKILKNISKAILIGNFNTISNPINIPLLSRLKCFDLEKLPRTTRAQTMDILSSQANIAGYKSILLALEHYQRFMPMLMTAAGTVKPARVVILGVGVAGLQAIATAKRLGAIVEASDVRPSVKDQVESLGGKFIDVPFETEQEKEIAEGKGGYAQMMPENWLIRQKTIVSEAVKKADIIITTALIPGKTPPVLIDAQTVKEMKAGSVIVDLAGGNCELTVADNISKTDKVTIVGFTNLPSMLAEDASVLFAKNVNAFLELIINADNDLSINLEDDLVKGCLIT